MAKKIYTKYGDLGKTNLINGQKVAKNHEQLNACGTVDELNAWVGLIRSYDDVSEQEKHTLMSIQKDLFSLCADMADDKGNATSKMTPSPLLGDNNVDFLENKIDKMDKTLPELNSFIIPGGYMPAAACHIARTVCRRAERTSINIAVKNDVNPAVIKYLNRLSDYFFVLARYLTHKNNNIENLWTNTI